MHHPVFDLERWVEEFPLARLRDEARDFVAARAAARPDEYTTPDTFEQHVSMMSPEGAIVVGPHDIAVIEQLRREGFGKDAPANGVATDVFAWGKGEPPTPYLTKIGGIPFRDRNKPWPRERDGRTRMFLAQLSFVDSRERFSKPLAGDVLLIFSDDATASGVITEWSRADEPSPLRPTDVPAEFLRPSRGADFKPHPAWGDRPLPKSWTEPLVVLHGFLHRGFDYPGSEVHLQAYRRPHNIALFEGTKIGGVPHFVQDAEGAAEDFLGAFGSTSIARERRFPLVNEERPHTWAESMSENQLMFGDMGSLYLFREALDIVRATMQSY
jgi:hypothetical protein